MNEEEVVITTIEEVDKQELARLYDLLSSMEPGSEEYDKILSLIEKIRKVSNESARIEQIYHTTQENNEHESELKTKELEFKCKELEQDGELKKKELKQRKLESALKIGETILKTGSTLFMSWVILKTNLKYGPIGTKDAWNMIFRKN